MATPKDGQAGTAVSPADPTDAEEADNADPGDVDQVKARQRELKQGKYGAASVAPYKPGEGADSDEKKSWIEVLLVDQDGNPVAGEKYSITLPDGKIDEGTTGGDGLVRFDGIDPGQCKIRFPDLDKDSWKPG